MSVDPKATTLWPVKPIGELLVAVRLPVAVQSTESYREIGIRSHCKGIFHKPAVTGKVIGDKRVFWVEPGCLVLNIVFAWEQAVAMTSEAEVGMIASHRFPMYRSRNGKLLPEYAWRYFSSPRGKYDLGMASPGGAGRNKTLGQEEFKRLKIPVPPVEYQRTVIDVLVIADRAIDRTINLITAKRQLKQGLAQQLLTGRCRMGPGQWRNHEFGQLFAGANKKTKQVQRGEYRTSGRFPIVDQGRGLVAGYCNDDSVVYQDVPVIVFGDHTREVKFIDFPFVCGADGTQVLRTTSLLDIEFGYQLLRVLPLPSLGYSRHMRFLKEQVFRVPEKLHIQKRIAAVLGAADREVALLERKLAALRELRKGLMQKLLTGQVRATV